MKARTHNNQDFMCHAVPCMKSWKNKLWAIHVLQITGNGWNAYDPIHTKYHAIWSLAVDKNDNLWVGTQHNDLNQTLIKFDGTSWETVRPMTDKNELMNGTVSQLFSDSNRMYVAILSAEEPFSEQLLTFDGVTWNKIYGLPETDFFIREFKADPHRQAVWIRTSKCIYKLCLPLAHT